MRLKYNTCIDLGIRLVTAQDVHFLYVLSHLIVSQSGHENILAQFYLFS